MAHMIGADPVQLDTLGARMSTAAERLESIRTGIGALLAHSHWDGRDADDFRNLWHHQLAPRLHNAAAMTRAGATTLRTNAQQQRDASGVVVAGVGTLVSGGPQWVCRDVPEQSWLDSTFKVLGIGTLVAGAGELVAKVVNAAAKHWPTTPVGRMVDGFGKMIDDLPPVWKDIIKKKLPFVSIGIDLANFRHEFGKDPTSAATFNEGVATALSVAGSVPGPIGLIGTGLGIAHGLASLDDSPEHQEWLRGATIKHMSEVALGLAPSLRVVVSHVPTEVFVEGANAAERAIDTVLGIRNGGLNGVPEYCR